MATPRKALQPTEPRSSNVLPTPTTVSSNGSAGEGSSVQVVVRMRPPSDKEKANNDTMVVGVYPQHSEVRVVTNFKKGPATSTTGQIAQATNKQDLKTYTFDQTYGALSTQEEVYGQAVKPLVEEVLAGFNCTVFAYGQTGTGKTYTMEGALSETVSEHSGVIPRAIHTIFDQLAEGKYEDYSVKVSFLELYNEELADLLAEQEDRTTTSSMGSSSKPGDDSEKKELRIFEDVTGKKGMLVHNLEEVPVTGSAQVFALLQKANKNRKVAETNLNARSSRSHYVFIVTVHTKEYSEDGEDVIKTGKLYLVDLAGSECIGKSGATEKRAKEAGKINQSLLTLGRVINALVDRSSFVPYRDSKLTRLLQESLGGRAKTVIIATVSPSYAAFDETLSTLDYAHRAKSIKNKPQKAEVKTKRAYMKELLLEISSLKRDNEVLRSKNGIIIAPEKWERMQAETTGKGMQIDELLFKLKNVQTELQEKTEKADDLSMKLKLSLEDASLKSEQITELQKQLQQLRDEFAALQIVLAEKEALLTKTLEEKAQVEQKLAETIAILDTTRMVLAETKANLIASQNLLIQLQRRLHEREIELENTQAIVRAYQATEHDLTQQAVEVIATLQATIGQKNALHEKITRKTLVEEHNKSVTQVFDVKTNVNITQLLADQATFQGEMTSSFDATKQTVTQHEDQRQASLKSFSETHGAFNSDILGKIAAMDELCQADCKNHGELVDQHAINAKTFFNKTSEAYQQFSEKSEKDFTNAIEKVQDIRSKSTANFEASQKEFTQVHEQVSTFVQKQLTPSVLDLAEASKVQSISNVTASQDCLSKLAQFETKQNALIASDSQAFKARIGTDSSALKDQIQDASHKLVTRLQADSSRFTQHNQDNSTALVQRFTADSSSLKSTIQSNSDALKSHITQMQEEMMKKQEEMMAAIVKMQSEFMSQVTQMIDTQREQHLSQIATSATTQIDQVQKNEQQFKADFAATEEQQVAQVWSNNTTQLAFIAANHVAQVEQIEHQESQQLQHVAENVKVLTSDINAVIIQEQDVQSKFQADVAQFQTATASFTAGINSWSQAASENNTKFSQDMDGKITNFHTFIQTEHDASQATVKQWKEAVNARSIESEKENVSFTASLEAAKSTMVASFAQATSATSSHATVVKSWVDHTAIESAAQTQSIQTHVEQSSSVLSAYAPKFDTVVSDMKSTLSTFIASDLHVDMPLGTTPQKAEISHVVREGLIATASPNTIISNYRAGHPMSKLTFQGIIPMEGVEEVEAEEAAPAKFIAAPSSTRVSGSAPIEVEQVEVSFIPPPVVVEVITSTVAPVAAARTSSPPVISLRLSDSAKIVPAIPTPTATASTPTAQVTPLILDDSQEDGENVRPMSANVTPSHAAETPTNSIVMPEKAAAPGLKRPTSSRLAAPKVSTTTTAATKPVTRSRFGYASGDSK